jgi:uncharacterized protein YvpB
MNRLNEIAGIRIPTPLVNAEENGTIETTTQKPLYQPTAAFQRPTASSFNLPSASALVATATKTPSANANGTTLLPNIQNMPFYIQQGNACGTTTLAEIMTYLGKTETQADVDKAIRRDDVFTAPEDMIQFARDNGLQAQEYNNGTWDQVKQQIDSGHAVQALVEGDNSVPVMDGASNGNFSVSGLHYIAITGYGTDPTTGQGYVVYHDPNRGTEQRMSVSDFEKMWGNVPAGYHNYYQAYGAAGSNLSEGTDSIFNSANSGIQGTQGTLNGIANILNGWDRWTGPGNQLPSFLHGVSEVAGGIPQTVMCGIGAGLQIGSSWLSSKVSGIPVVQNLVLPLTDAVGGVGAAIADVGNGIGESMDDVGSSLEDLAHGDGGKALDKLGDAAEDVGSGVAHAAVDTVTDVGHAIADLFSW